MNVLQCSDSPPEIPQEILDKYKKPTKLREFEFKDIDRKTVLAKGVVEEVILVYHDADPKEYWKGVEKLRRDRLMPNGDGGNSTFAHHKTT